MAPFLIGYCYLYFVDIRAYSVVFFSSFNIICVNALFVAFDIGGGHASLPPTWIYVTNHTKGLKLLRRVCKN